MEDQTEDLIVENSELNKVKKQAEECLSNWKRERADFVNYKKDETKRMEEFLKFSSEGLIRELLDVIDEIEVTRSNYPKDGDKVWFNGFEGSLNQFYKFLSKFGVEKIRIEGEIFDPLLHEAVELEDKDGQNIQEVRSGYTMYGKVIRPARVKITK